MKNNTKDNSSIMRRYSIKKDIEKKIIMFSFLFLAISLQGNAQQNKESQDNKWFPNFDFDANKFNIPFQQYGPFARWWWPGNDVVKEELEREVNLFADYGFAGVEIQPLVIGIPMNAKVRGNVLSWDTPKYYDNLKAVMEIARKRNVIVDVTNGSGWPPGGSFLNPEDGFLSLEFTEVNIDGGQKKKVTLPVIENKSSSPAQMQAVLAVKIIDSKDNKSGESVHLDANTAHVLTASVKNNTLEWNFPKGKWKVIVLWSLPSGEQTNIAAMPEQGPVVDHFDSNKVRKIYEHLFGERTGLQPYFGNPMRAVFNDSYEFKANRHYSLDFISFFKKNRGYDITPWLPANMQKGYNYVLYLRPDVKPDFYFSNEDWRLRYDYDLTLSELLKEHFFEVSKNWLEGRGLLHRTQAYGLNMDMIAMAGEASIPETESMLGPEANMKIMTSGGLLYNRPIVSAESTVSINQAYTTSPQKIKIALDKLFAAGVNQVIYHGVPYRYTPEKLGTEGWYPFSTPFIPAINFSTNLGEGNIFWKDQKEINQYVSRVQYALRSGKPHADVLIYFPFMNVEGMPENPEEIFPQEYTPTNKETVKEKTDPEKIKWASKAYPLINALEAKGISWAFVNDVSLQQAKLDKDLQINIRDNTFKSLILVNTEVIQLKTSEQIKFLSGKGMQLIGMGTLPQKQPSFLDWKKNDKKTAENIASAIKSKNSLFLSNDSELKNWTGRFKQSVAFGDFYNFTRQVQREMSDGSRAEFIWNKSDQWKTINLTLDSKFRSSFWMDATNGAVLKNQGSTVSYKIGPYSSIILFASTQSVSTDDKLSASQLIPDVDKEILNIKNWDIQVENFEIKNSLLFDWRTNENLKYSSNLGVYKSDFKWETDTASKHFFLDLGKVSYTAEIYINGKFAGKKIFAPYLLDITSFLKSGTNSLEIRVTPGQLNGFVGNAKKGDKRYNQFKEKDEQLISAGLIGPVVIRQESSE